MAEPASEISLPPRGVRNASVEALESGGITCYFSRYHQFPGGTAEELKQDALDFHWAIHHVFERHAVVPFRFPTLVADEGAISKFLAEHSAEYLADLQRLRDRVQMEVRLPAPSANAAAASASPSGAAYLKSKFDAAQRVLELETRIKSAAPQAEWKQRAHRYFALIQREQAEDFRARIQALGEESLRVSGPWPPSEFVNCYPDLKT